MGHGSSPGHAPCPKRESGILCSVPLQAQAQGQSQAFREVGRGCLDTAVRLGEWRGGARPGQLLSSFPQLGLLVSLP